MVFNITFKMILQQIFICKLFYYNLLIIHIKKVETMLNETLYIIRVGLTKQSIKHQIIGYRILDEINYYSYLNQILKISQNLHLFYPAIYLYYLIYIYSFFV